MSGAADPGELPERLQSAMTRAGLPPALSAALACELSLWAFALAGWRMRTPADANAFSVHRESSWSMAAVGIGLVLVVEALPIHFLLVRSHPTLAVIATATSVYGLLWLIGDAQAMRLRPMRIEPDALLVRVGLRSKALVPLDAIASVEPVKADAAPKRGRGTLRATPIGDPTLLLTLREPLVAHGPYGVPLPVARIGVAADERARFASALEAALGHAAPERR